MTRLLGMGCGLALAACAAEAGDEGAGAGTAWSEVPGADDAWHEVDDSGSGGAEPMGEPTATPTAEPPPEPGPGVCGNRTLDHGEVCDGDDLAGEDCRSLGLGHGDLECNDDCSGYVLDDCRIPATCGDGVMDEDAGEACDGQDLDGEDCESEGFAGGALACAADCTFDHSGCVAECVEEGDPCDGPEDCCNAGCGAGGSFCTDDGVSVCCS